MLKLVSNNMINIEAELSLLKTLYLIRKIKIYQIELQIIREISQENILMSHNLLFLGYQTANLLVVI